MQPPAASTGCDQENRWPAGGGEAVAAPRAPASWRSTLFAAGLIVLSGVAAYHNSFAGAFVYDDDKAIVENGSIRHLWPVWQALSPPLSGATVRGRPLLNLSLAINYALGGLNVWGYHAVNLLIHVAAALLLFGILRRTFLLPALRDRFGKAATPLALAGALVWTVHPLQTESVTYIVQRAESLGGLFYLLTLYCVIRGAQGTVPFSLRENRDSPQLWPRLWYAAAVCACLLGMACKEVMVTAPLIVLLYDRTFLAGSFGNALGRRWGLYVGLAATWGLLVPLELSTGLIGRQLELTPDPWGYARSQPGVILHYLRLSVWPSPLCLDYAWPAATRPAEILPGAIVVGVLLAATVWGLTRGRTWGFLGAWFLLILAPTSSIFPLNQLAFEHRMYLSLAAVAVLAVAGGYVLWDRLLPRPATSEGELKNHSLCQGKMGTRAASSQAPNNRRATVVRWAVPVAVWTAVCLALGCVTVVRNNDFRSSVAIWQDTVDKSPNNPVVQDNLGLALAVAGRTSEAIEHYHTALRLKPDYAPAHNNLGMVLTGMGRLEEARRHFQEALRLYPDDATAHNNLGIVLASLGESDEAIEHYHQALQFRPEYATAHNSLGVVLAQTGRANEAVQHYQQALRLRPDFADAHNNLAAALADLGKTDEAVEHYRQALRLRPKYAEAHYNLAGILDRSGRTKDAIEHYNKYLQLVPNSLEVLNNLAWLLATREPAHGGDPARAVQLAQRARELGGQENAQCLDTLAAAYAAAGRLAEAVLLAEQVLALAQSTGQTALAKNVQSRLELYRAGRPYREAPPSPQ